MFVSVLVSGQRTRAQARKLLGPFQDFELVPGVRNLGTDGTYPKFLIQKAVNVHPPFSVPRFQATLAVIVFRD
jgi:hypothetical protein